MHLERKSWRPQLKEILDNLIKYNTQLYILNTSHLSSTTTVPPRPLTPSEKPLFSYPAHRKIKTLRQPNHQQRLPTTIKSTKSGRTHKIRSSIFSFLSSIILLLKNPLKSDKVDKILSLKTLEKTHNFSLQSWMIHHYRLPSSHFFFLQPNP